MDYFDFFGIPVSFFPDEVDLRQRFLKNSKLYHPDFHTMAPEAQQAEILEKSTLNNQAYLTLADFDKRLKYILELKGMLEEGKNELPNEFLTEMMDINEAIMELEFDFDDAVYQSALTKAAEIEEELLNSVKPTMQNYEDGVTSLDLLKPVKDFYLKRRYLWRIKDNLDKFAPASKEVR